MIEEWYLHLGEMVYLDTSFQKNPSYVGTRNWVLLQDVDSKQKWSIFTKEKYE